MMYDLSGLKAGEAERIVVPDWRQLSREGKVTKDATYLHHRGKPLVAIWGIGFSDDREYTLDECARLIRFFKAEGCSVMIGVPYHWRKLHRDAVKDAALHSVIALADVVSPWAVGRYGSPKQARSQIGEMVPADLAWTAARQLDYLPVIFPGFSWHNLKRNHGETAALNLIPREGGDFLWSQAVANKRAGAKMIYVAMFDEIDEGTAIFKCTNNPPVGASKFITYEGLPSDHYLWLTGRIRDLLANEIPASDKLPTRRPAKR